MMKKLLTLMLVLVLASTANAVVVGSYSLHVAPVAGGPYVLGVDSEVTLYPSDYLWIGVNNSVAGQAGADQQCVLYLGIQVPIVGGHEEIDPDTGEPYWVNEYGPADTVWTGGQIMFKPPLVPGAPSNEWLGVGEMGTEEGMVAGAWWKLILTDGNPEHFQGIGVLDAKELHCIGPTSEDTIWLVDSAGGVVLDKLVIHQVSEPMTVMLLGPCGLLLRRRNK